MNIKIKKITLVKMELYDELYIETYLPCPYLNESDKTDNLSFARLKLSCPPNTGEEYCNFHFRGVELNIKDGK